MFTWLHRKREQSELTRLFDKYVPPDAIKYMAARPNQLAEANNMAKGPVEFILASVHCITASETGVELGALAQRASQAGWLVQTYMSNLVLLVSGVLPAAGLREPRNTFVPQLLGPRSKAVHGLRQASFGLMGGPTRMAFGALLPDFLSIVCALQEVEIGHAKELAE